MLRVWIMFKIFMLLDIIGFGLEYYVGDEVMVEVVIEWFGKLVGKENFILGCVNFLVVFEIYGIWVFVFYYVIDSIFCWMLWRCFLFYFKVILINFYCVLKCDKVFICGGGNMMSVWLYVLEFWLRFFCVVYFLRCDVYLVS